MGIALSVIIPIFNGQSYITSLFQEIADQHIADLEVILVDDGSTDGSSEMIEAAMDAYHGDIVWRLIRQENRGQGGARNTGLEAAYGEWVMFCDQDDHMREGYLRTMLESAQSYECDILLSGYETVDLQGKVLSHVSLHDTSWSRFMNVTPWGKVYRAAFLREHGIRFYETPYGEDIYLMLMCEAAGARTQITSYVGYQWVQNAASVSHTTHRILNREASALSLISKVVAEVANLDLQNPEIQYFLLKTAIYHVLYIAGTADPRILCGYNNDLFAELEKVCPGILFNALIRPWRPVGERGRIRVIVWIYTVLHRCHLDGGLLTIYGMMTAEHGESRT